MFTGLSLVCKYLVKLLAPDPLPTLRAAAGLRLHAAPHVRDLAARALGFLLRHAPPAALRAALRHALGEAVRSPTPERLDGAGALAAEAVTGVGQGLHSRAGAVLGLLLGQELLRPQDFKPKVGGGRGEGPGQGACCCTCGADASHGSVETMRNASLSCHCTVRPFLVRLKR